MSKSILFSPEGSDGNGGNPQVSDADVKAIDAMRGKYGAMKDEMAKVIIGQDEVVERLLICVLSRGHALLMGVPGLAKTLMVNSLSKVMSLDFSRIQFTPDLMPSDITGTDILQETVEGRRFGYQLTFFRVGINPSPINPSQWTVRDLHMAHFAITDVERGTHRVSERLNRSGVGWAGASTDTLQVWNEEWRASMTGTTHRLQAIDTTEHGELSLDLRLDSGDAVPVRHCLLYTSPSPRDGLLSRMPSSA